MPAERERLAQIKKNLERRAEVYGVVREFFRKQGFLEIETPLRVLSIAPERYISPIKSEGWYLITSPELHMKRLLAAGYKQIFQISRCFRGGERGRLHNPEFSLLEWYRAGADYQDSISDAEQLVVAVIQKLHRSKILHYQGQNIDMQLPWPRLSVKDAFLQSAGWDPVAAYDAERFDYDMAALVLPALDPAHPTVLTDYPAAAASLARLKTDNPLVAERAEIFIGGIELANAYSELTDAAEQRRRFEKEAAQIEREYGTGMQISEPFLEAVGYLPECSGIALGMDRLVMLLCDAVDINEICAFTENNI
ncbi:MAG: EF-P lysine aminoacylase EpmA [Dehalococcoidia bacterium]|nr:EF-P lysine aminoacylase EpmA [Dehalococcoidia bacterium]